MDALLLMVPCDWVFQSELLKKGVPQALKPNTRKLPIVAERLEPEA
jgi:hypothetical protein